MRFPEVMGSLLQLRREGDSVTLHQPPPGTAGNTRLIRTSLPLLREDPQDCPRGNALRARPLVAQAPERPRGKPIEDFALGPVMRTLDLIEYEGMDPQVALRRLNASTKCHPGHASWAGMAVNNYLAAREASETDRRALGRPATTPVRAQWTAIAQSPGDAPDERGATRYERTAWGRRYASADGSERELWLLSVNTVKKDRPHPEIAEAAAVTATGVPTQAAFGDIHRPLAGSTVPPRQVRVIGLGCGDGRHTVLADWDTGRTAHEFTLHAKPVLARVAEDDRLNPGSGCERCEGLTGCEQPPRVNGLLGIPGPRRPANAARSPPPTCECTPAVPPSSTSPEYFTSGPANPRANPSEGGGQSMTGSMSGIAKGVAVAPLSPQLSRGSPRPNSLLPSPCSPSTCSIAPSTDFRPMSTYGCSRA